LGLVCRSSVAGPHPLGPHVQAVQSRVSPVSARKTYRHVPREVIARGAVRRSIADATAASVLLGSITEQVVRGSSAPIVTVRPTPVTNAA
jgi:nucleotide-binding universal stress UspA family protein